MAHITYNTTVNKWKSECEACVWADGLFTHLLSFKYTIHEQVITTRTWQLDTHNCCGTLLKSHVAYVTVPSLMTFSNLHGHFIIMMSAQWRYPSRQPHFRCTDTVLVQVPTTTTMMMSSRRSAIPASLLPTAFLEMTPLCSSKRFLAVFLPFLLRDTAKANY